MFSSFVLAAIAALAATAVAFAPAPYGSFVSHRRPSAEGGIISLGEQLSGYSASSHALADGAPTTSSSSSLPFAPHLDTGVSRPAAHAAGGTLLGHYAYPVSYATFGWDRHGSSAPQTGLTWGVECKAAGCAVRTTFVASPSTGSAPLQGHVVSHTPWTDESHKFGKIFCPTGHFASAIDCKDSECTAIRLLCSPLASPYAPNYGLRFGGVWETPGYRRVYCNEGEYMDGAACVESCTKHFNIFCTKVLVMH